MKREMNYEDGYCSTLWIVHERLVVFSSPQIYSCVACMLVEHYYRTVYWLLGRISSEIRDNVIL